MLNGIYQPSPNKFQGFLIIPNKNTSFIFGRESLYTYYNICCLVFEAEKIIKHNLLDSPYVRTYELLPLI